MSFATRFAAVLFLSTGVVPGAALAQPAEAEAEAEERQVQGRVYTTDAGDVMIGVNRSNVFRVVDAAWARHLRNAKGEQVEATLKVVRRGLFGGDVEVLDLVREVEGAIELGEDGGVILSKNRSNVFPLRGEAWPRFLRRYADQQVTVRLRVLEPGWFGGPAEVLSVVRDVCGQVQLPAGGGPVISVNRSNLFQVSEGPLRARLLAAHGRTVEARIRIVEPHMFGGEAELESLQARHSGTQPLTVHGTPSTESWSTGAIEPGASVTVTGEEGGFLEVELEGRRGYAAASDLEIGQAPTLPDAAAGILGSLPR